MSWVGLTSWCGLIVPFTGIGPWVAEHAFCWWHEAYEVQLHEKVTPKAVEKNATLTLSAILLAGTAAYYPLVVVLGTLVPVLLGGLFRQAPIARARRTDSFRHLEMWN
ncbi:hypothetical protein RY831_26955 [Noviherbaspirillum sp. CPCC 100848]|uniref:Transmembrane protein n=1 Tax=Noviherbaspirillum album TaxID=3080276 RepID=A0ABU6JGY4_9BURK|nr:hypothetical protein [Noviherbaspirillum sp. CPCC 100848]MEC4722803.1 hypothetical protein [Noviherbaspirillum sp. CPCC 100848]